MATVTVLQGDHSSTPSTLSTFTAPSEMEADVQFTNSCVYNHNNSNQSDWNKLLGFASTYYFTSDSARWGWRYNVSSSIIEIAPFIHQGGSMVLPSSGQILQIPLNTTYKLKIVVERTNNKYKFISTISGTDTVIEVSPGSLSGKYTTEGYNELQYFGGTEVAPHDIDIVYNNVALYVCKRYQVAGTGQSWRVSFTTPDGQRDSYYGSAWETKVLFAREGTMTVTLASPTVSDLGHI